MMRFLLCCLTALLPFTMSAQRVVKGDCTPPSEGSATRVAPKRLPSVFKSWNPYKVYRQMVVLVSFSDCDFQSPDPQATYDSIFNCRGYNRGEGPGCVADYFREQSGGRCNLQFDVFGPFKISSKACPYDAPTESTRNYGRSQMVAATKECFRQNSEHKFKQYDWDGDGYVNQIVYITAGYSGNQGEESYGYVWPNTSTFNSMLTCPDGTYVWDYTCSGELWLGNTLCGIGTICHEFSHSLGLPDIYPTSSAVSLYSVADEWDLMDGGNFTNYGWCPPNYSPLEKMLLGWLTPTMLTEPVAITGMKSISEGGSVYQVHHTDSEYLLLENRQQQGWDSGLPGQGLVIYHVDYRPEKWQNNSVNSTWPLRYQLIPADNRNYDDWSSIIGTSSPYQNSDMMNSRFLQDVAYPYASDGESPVLNNSLTDQTTPASLMNNENAHGSKYLSQPVTDIEMSADGLVSFLFRGDDLAAIRSITHSSDGSEGTSAGLYDLQGRRVTHPLRGHLYVKNGKKIIYH